MCDFNLKFKAAKLCTEEVHFESRGESIVILKCCLVTFSCSSITDEAVTEPIHFLSSQHRNGAETSLSDRRPSLCTRISVSSSISPTLSSRTNVSLFNYIFHNLTKPLVTKE